MALCYLPFSLFLSADLVAPSRTIIKFIISFIFPIRKISVPRHDPAHLDQYLRVVLLLWTRSKRCRLESCQYPAFGISIEKRPNRVIKLGGIVRHLCTPSSEIPYSGVRGRGEVRVGRTGFRRPNLAAPGWIISDQRVEFDDISPQACRLFQCHRSHPVGTCGK